MHPRQISFSENEVLWRPCLTGRYLISGGRNETADRPTINKISADLPKDLPKRINLATKVTTYKVSEGRLITTTEDMKEKVFKQLTGLDSVLVTPCTAYQTCREQTNRMAEPDLLEFEALRKTGTYIYTDDRNNFNRSARIKLCSNQLNIVIVCSIKICAAIKCFMQCIPIFLNLYSDIYISFIFTIIMHAYHIFSSWCSICVFFYTLSCFLWNWILLLFHLRCLLLDKEEFRRCI